MRRRPTRWLDILWRDGLLSVSWTSLNDKLMSKLEFNVRPAPVLPEHRRMYKISQILLILELSSWGGKSTLPRLQLFNWALKSHDRQERLATAAKVKILNIQAWGFDPALSIALRFAVAEILINSVPTGYQITDRGKLFVMDIEKDPDLLPQEKEMLMRIGKGVTEAMVEAVAKGWRT